MFFSQHGLTLPGSIEIDGRCHSGYKRAFSDIASRKTILGSIVRDFTPVILCTDPFLAQYQSPGNFNKTRGFMKTVGYLLLLPLALLFDGIASIGISAYVAIKAKKIVPGVIERSWIQSIGNVVLSTLTAGALGYAGYKYYTQSA